MVAKVVAETEAAGQPPKKDKKRGGGNMEKDAAEKDFGRSLINLISWNSY